MNIRVWGSVVLALAVLSVLVVVAVVSPVGPVSASSAGSSGAAPQVTNTPRPTVIPEIRKFPQIVVQSNWATPASAWSNIYSQSKLPVPVDGDLCITLGHKSLGYSVLGVNASATAVWAATPSAGYPSSGRVSIVGASVGTCP